MQKSTIFLVITCLILSAAIGVIMALMSPTLYSPRDPEAVNDELDIGLPELTKEKDSDVIEAESAILWDGEAQVIEFEKNAFERRPIASLTKLMTAMFAIDHGVDWDKKMTIEKNEYRIGGRLALAPDEWVTMKDLLRASLMGSANNATLAFVRGTGMSQRDFIRAMNRKAVELGLEQTEFTGVTGLDPDNISTAYDVARLAAAAYNDYPIIAEITSTLRYEHIIGGTERDHTIVNTDNLLVDYGYPLTGSKTGYLYEAGFCLAVQGDGVNKNRVAVVLGAPSEWDSMSDVKTLLEMP